MATPIVVVRPPNRQRLVLLLEARIELGRECDGLLISDTRMSRRHVALEPAEDGSVLVTDLHSSNGTIVDGTPLSNPLRVPTGGVVWAGDTQITIGAMADAERATTETSSPGSTDTTPQSSIEAVAEEVSGHLRPELIGVGDEPGTLTVVFTDIEGSTGMAVLLGDEVWFDRLNQHQSLVTAHSVANGGRIVKGQGDGFMLCFRSARQGLLFAIGLERDLELAASRSEPPMRVRVGLHTGEVMVTDGGDLIGRHVVVAARIANLAVGGEILASSLVKQIAEPRGDVRFIEPRQAELKGIEGSETVYGVDWRSFGT